MKPLKERIVNLDNRDYHMHTSNFSDWIPTINELVQFAGTMWMKEIAITDHSQVAIDLFKKKYNVNSWSTCFYSLARWWNVFNDVSVIFWVEWDLLNEKWDVCFNIQWSEPEFIILSVHKDIYNSPSETIMNSFEKAIESNYKKIKFIWHPCSTYDWGEHINIEKIVKIANKYNIPLEFNWKNFVNWQTDLEKLDYLLNNANHIYINSDAHTLYEFREARKKAIEYLYEKKYL